MFGVGVEGVSYEEEDCLRACLRLDYKAAAAAATGHGRACRGHGVPIPGMIATKRSARDCDPSARSNMGGGGFEGNDRIRRTGRAGGKETRGAGQRAGKEQARLQNSRGGGGVCPLGQCTNLGPAFRLVRVRSDRVSKYSGTWLPWYKLCSNMAASSAQVLSSVYISPVLKLGAPSNIPIVCFITVMSTTSARDMPPLRSRISLPVPPRRLSCPPQDPASIPPSSSDPS